MLTGSARIYPQDGTLISYVFLAVRYNSNGSLDATFDSDGKVFTALASGAVATSAVLQPDGKILIGGNILLRYNSNGALDISFGTGGTTMLQISSFVDLKIQADNKLVVVSRGANVVRFNSAGTFDSTFRPYANLSNIPSVTAAAIAVQSDGKIVIGGSIGDAGARDFLLARFEATFCTDNCPTPGRDTFADFDGDGKTDFSVARNGMWFINPSSVNNPNSFYGVQLGLASDKLVPADYDGDSKQDIAIWREEPNSSAGVFYILRSTTNTVYGVEFGKTGDNPSVVGDWDGDNRADLAVYRSGRSAGEQSYFYYRPSSQPLVNFVAVPWGTTDDEPVRGDFDGDGRADAAVFRSSDAVWYILQSSNGQALFERWGLASDKRVTVDYDGDGKTDLAIYRDGLWAVSQSSNNQARYINWGLSTDQLVAGDYDGDGRTDYAVWRAGVFYVLKNSDLQPIYQNFGVLGDIPIASAFVRRN